MADQAHSTPASDPILAIREGLERYFAEQGIAIDLAAVLPPLPPAPEPARIKDRGLARAYLNLEAAVAELHNIALVTDMIIIETMTARGEARNCVLDQDRADALEYAVGKLTAPSAALNGTYAAPWRQIA